MSTVALPPLRQELSILRDPIRGRWLIHDPVRGRFHAIGERAFRILSDWEAMPPDTLLSRLQRRHDDLALTAEDLGELSEFGFREQLFNMPAGADTERFAGRSAAQDKPWFERLLHGYLFIKFPLWNPQSFLNKTGPTVSRFMTAWTFRIIAILGAIGLYFAARQWDSFVSTFLYFFTPTGLAFYGISLAIIKVLHELGHAYATRHFGARVPVIGLAFLVMFPILYTDTTDAWRIHDRRARTLINSAGVIVELSIAAISLLLWAFLPDGPWRSAAFFAATTSWTMSLLVNLNPWMRFDGYYLISDFLGVENLQQRGFEIGRRVMRRTLWGLQESATEAHTRQHIAAFCAYAWSTWIYRFFLFIGIAILVHHIFPKAIGIVLFVVEIGIFIALPLWREARHWWSSRMQILSNSRGRFSLASCGAALAVFLVPWQSSVTAPAVIRPVADTQIFAPSSGEISKVQITTGQVVNQNDILFILHDPALDHRKSIADLELTAAQARWNQQAASSKDRAFRDVLADELRDAEETVTAINRQLDQLIVRAPHAGRVSEVDLALRPKTYWTPNLPILRLSNMSAMEIIALPRDNKAQRVSPGAAFTFISDAPGQIKRRGYIANIAPVALAVVDEPVLTVIGGGPIAVSENDRGDPIPNAPVIRIEGAIEGVSSLREERGVVKIKAEPRSPAHTLWNSVMCVLLREADF